MNETNDFSTGKLFPMILKYSIPAAISLLITAIYNIVDRIFVGNFNGTSALAGLSICFPLSYMMMAFGLTCSAGGSSLFSLFAGKGEQKNMNRSFGNALLLVVVFEVFLSVFLLIFSNPIPKEDVKAIVENASEIHRPVFLAGVEGGGANGCDKDLADYFAIAKSKVNVLDNFDFEKLMDKKVYQMMVGCYKEEYADILRDVDGARITAWWTRAADITPANGNKGVGVRKILDYYHLDKENAIAFGDGTNDIEMLEAVGTGVAMGNATDDVKAVAGAICGHVAEDGIYHYCKEQGLI